MTRFEPGFTENNPADYMSDVVVDVIESRDGETFFVERGHTDDFIDQLIRKSRQELIVQNCPKDSTERFTSREAFERWLEKDGGRAPYFLADSNGELAGLVWYGQSDLDESVLPDFPPESKPNHTFAIRIYDGFNGKGLAKGFIKSSMNDYIWKLAGNSQYDDFNGFHLETDRDNEGAVRLYEAIGYVAVDTDDDSERMTMVLSADGATEYIESAQVE